MVQRKRLVEALGELERLSLEEDEEMMVVVQQVAV